MVEESDMASLVALYCRGLADWKEEAAPYDLSSIPFVYARCAPHLCEEFVVRVMETVRHDPQVLNKAIKGMENDVVTQYPHWPSVRVLIEHGARPIAPFLDRFPDESLISDMAYWIVSNTSHIASTEMLIALAERGVTRSDVARIALLGSLGTDRVDRVPSCMLEMYRTSREHFEADVEHLITSTSILSSMSDRWANALLRGHALGALLPDSCLTHLRSFTTGPTATDD